jgi:hypothetical protein
LKRIGYLINENLLALALGVLVGLVSLSMGKAPELSFIAGLSATAVGYGFAILARIDRAQDEIIRSRRTYVDLLKIANEFYDDPWLHHLALDLVPLTKRAGNNVFERALVGHVVDKAVKEADDCLPKIVTFVGREAEITRATELVKIIGSAQSNLQAITYDEENFKVFWQIIGPHYTKANIEAAKRKVKIERIFILPDEVLQTTATHRTQELKRTVREQQEAGIDLRFISKELLKAIAPTVYASTTGFLICDERVFSASYVTVAGSKDCVGYICNGYDFENLTRRFTELRTFAKPAAEFKFMSE